MLPVIRRGSSFIGLFICPAFDVGHGSKEPSWTAELDFTRGLGIVFGLLAKRLMLFKAYVDGTTESSTEWIIKDIAIVL